MHDFENFGFDLFKKNNDGDDDLKKKMNKAWPNAPSLTINVILRSFIARWLLLE